MARADDWSILRSLAEKGCFLREHSSYDTGRGIPFADIEQKSFGIRLATLDDIHSLMEIERECWSPMGMEVTKDIIEERLYSCPNHQWVASNLADNSVLGVIYTQRIDSLSFMMDKNFTFAELPSLRRASGNILQLVAVAAFSSAKSLRIGVSLRNFMLLQALSSDSISKVIAITRCSNFLDSLSLPPQNNSAGLDDLHKDFYLKYALSARDPTIQFHCSSGAKILSTMHHSYRVSDTENLGSGVVVGYYCSMDDIAPGLLDNLCTKNDTGGTSHLSFDSKNCLTFERLKEMIAKCLGDRNIANNDGFFDTPFMILGMDSLQMIELTKELEDFLTEDDISNTSLLFDHPTPRRLIEYLNGTAIDCSNISVNQDSDEPIEYAIVGMSCRFPGGADSPEKFYQLLCSRYNPLGPIPEAWEWPLGSGDVSLRDMNFCFLDDISAESFDAKLFGLSKAEVSAMDPHQRILLTTGYEALLDAEIFDEPDENDSTNEIGSINRDIGVFVGLCNTHWNSVELKYNLDNHKNVSMPSAYTGMGTAMASAANRLSFLLNLVGPSMVIDTACSSSLAAVHAACQSLRNKECSAALVAAADLILCPYDLEVRNASHMLSPDGICKAFDESADGYGRGEGAGAVVLRRLKDAEADFLKGKGPPVLAVIKSTVLNQDGKSASFTAPSGLSQQSLLRLAVGKANIQPECLSFLETHGTGTPLGDPIEFNAIKSIFLDSKSDTSLKQPSSDTSPLYLGAVKANIGHLEGAAGMAGLIKTIMCVIHKSCPPNIHFNTKNPAIAASASSRRAIFPCSVTPLIPENLSMNTNSLIAGVSSFGSGGTNSHVILQSHSHTTSASFYVEEPQVIAESRSRTKSRSDSIDKILVTNSSKVVFLVTGQGSSADLLTKSIGSSLYRTESVFRAMFDKCSSAFEESKRKLEIWGRDEDEDSLSLVDVLLQSKGDTKIVNVALYTQCMLYALTLSMAKLWQSKGVDPDILLGHSLGEYTVAAIADIFGIEEGMLLVALRADCIAKVDKSVSNSKEMKGIMVAVRTSAREASAAIKRVLSNEDGKTLLPTVSVVNGPSSCVISGHAYLVHKVVKGLDCSSKELAVTNAFHSPLMCNAAQMFKQKAQAFIDQGQIIFNLPTKNIVSSVTGKCVAGNDMISLDYWVDHIVKPVLFYDSLLTLFGNRKSDKPIFPDISIVAEIGPGDTLTKLVKPVNVGTIIPQQRKIQWVMSFSASGVRRSFENKTAELAFFEENCERALLELKIHQLKRKFKHANWTQTEMHRWRHKGKYVSASGSAVGTDKCSHSGTERIASREAMVQVIKNILTDVLLHSVDMDDVDEHTSLVSLGVDSLGAIQIKNQLSREFGDISLMSSLVFDYPSISSMCEHISEQLKSSHISNEPPNNDPGPVLNADSPIKRSYVSKNERIETAFETTRMQQAMLFYHLSEPKSCSFVETFSWIIEKQGHASFLIDRKSFQRAWILTVLAIPSLRSTFDLEVEPPVQIVWNSKATLEMLEDETSSWFKYERAPVESSSEDEYRKLAELKTKQHRIDGGIIPSDDVLFKVTLVEIVHRTRNYRDSKYLLIMTFHHGIVDGYSMPTILSTFSKFYTECGLSLVSSRDVGELPSYEKFSHYENSLLKSSRNVDPIKHYHLLQLQDYWMKLLSGWRHCNRFRNMPPATIDAEDGEVTRICQEVDPKVTETCEEAARKVDVTLASLVHAAWAIVYRLSVVADENSSSLAECSDILYGCTTTGRSAPVSNLCEVVGPVLNTFPVRFLFPSRTESVAVVDFVREVHDQLVSSVNCETLPLTEIQRLSSAKARSMFPIIVDYQHASIFNCNFVEDENIQLRNLSLVDRIGCPLSVRIIVGKGSADTKSSIKLLATSECLAYDNKFMFDLLSAFSTSLKLVSSSILELDGVGACLSSLESSIVSSMMGFVPFRKTEDTLRSESKYNESRNAPLSLPILPTIPSNDGTSNAQGSFTFVEMHLPASDANRIVESIKDMINSDVSIMQCFQLVFFLFLKRWSSSSAFQAAFKYLHEPLCFFSINVEAPWADSSFQNIVSQGLPLKTCSGSIDSPSSILLDTTSEPCADFDHREKLVLLCLHTAGGSATQFAGWADKIDSNRYSVEVVCLELPGHGSMLMEKVLDKPSDIVEDIVTKFSILMGFGRDHVRGPFCILGYSMGAILAYELSVALRKLYQVEPLQLFIFAEACPLFLKPDIDPYMATAEFAKRLVDQEWYPCEVLDLPEADLDVFVNVARTDLGFEQSYSSLWKEENMQESRYKLLSCPISVYYGNEDKTLFGLDLERSSISSLQGWRILTKGAFSLHEVPGPHLFMNNEETKSKVLKSISLEISTVLRMPATHAVINKICYNKIKQCWVAQFCVQTSEFNDAVIKKMQQTYKSLFDIMCSPNSKDWNEPISSLLPPAMQSSPLSACCTVPTELLHEPFMRGHSSNSSTYAVVSFDKDNHREEISCSRLCQWARAVAQELLLEVPSLQKSDVVVVYMEKGWEQVVAVLAVHLLHCAYLPMDAKSWSEARVRQVLEMSESVSVITQSHVLSKAEWLLNLDIPILDANVIVSSDDEHSSDDLTRLLHSRESAGPDDLAYLIYTSGSTGVPKGVCCHHKGALNTIMDLNNRFDVSSSDRVLGLSSLSFDLSVYDIFGMLSVGGTLVLPHANFVSPPDPAEWVRIIESEGITIWNTVPAFMELLVSHLEFTGGRLPASVRLIYMSGDWIPVSLPSRIRAVSKCSTLRIISMGGATEAAIWSNMFELGCEGDGIPEGWSSVPYGRPLGNQTMYVLNEELEHCEVYVTGVVYIGGAGVAKGYYKSPERTSYQFITHPRSGEYLFRTGDLGRVRPCGNIEILGREDSQVKVNGYRIELGEIERVLMNDERLSSAVLNVCNNALCAYVVLSATGGDVEEEALFASLRDKCRSSLTDYMVPRHFMVLEEIPLSANGKVDRGKLPDMVVNEFGLQSDVDVVDDDIAVSTFKNHKLLADLSGIWAEVLGSSGGLIDIKANFFSLGGDSLRSMQLVARARKKGWKLSVPEVFAHPTISSQYNLLSRKLDVFGPAVLGTSSDKPSDSLIFRINPSPSQAFDPYPLIGINKAHFVGLHTTSYSSSGIAPQIYFEWVIGATCEESSSKNYKNSVSGPVDVTALEDSVTLFCARHSHFRSHVTRTGQMQTLDYCPKYKISHVYTGGSSNDVDSLTAAEDHALQNRLDMTSNGPDVFSWPLFEVRVTHVGTARSIVHITVSLFLMDAMGDLIFRQELSDIYRAITKHYNTATKSMIPRRQLLHELVKNSLPPPSRLSFRDYSVAVDTQLPLSDEYLRAKKYWLSRLPHFPSGPDLPLALTKNNCKANKGYFSNRHCWISAEDWKRAQANCAAHFVTVPAMLLAAYSVVVSKWSRKKRFLLNILQCLRHQVHEDVNKTVGNCSSTILCDIDMSSSHSSLTFVEATQRVGKELSSNLEHACMSGVEVMQELNRLKGNTFQAVAPFIFTTPIGVENGNSQVQSRDWIFNERFFSEKVPHTACVNAIKADPSGKACASLDIVDGIFPDDVATGIHKTYCHLVDIMCSPNSKDWNEPISSLLPPAMQSSPLSACCTVPTELLHEPFMRGHSSNSSTYAVVSFDKDNHREEISCSRLCQWARAVAQELLLEVPSLQKSDVVVVYMEKGWEQVVAVLAVHLLHCAYLPMDAKSWSEARVRQVQEMSESVSVITQSHVLSKAEWLLNLDIPILDANVIVSSDDEHSSDDLTRLLHSRESAGPDDLAYLIYTSGSTGVPKGVCCHHKGALNTIMDLNNRFDVTSSDRVLGLSSLSFDLSVYDIFGMLSVGGTLVLPHANFVSPPDPAEWVRIIESEGITIWNTVPAFMELLVSHLEFTGGRLPASVRLIYMSGDWIPVSLPSRIRAVSKCSTLRIISMGGATEAAIWSNMFELGCEGDGIPEGWSSVPYGRPLGNQTMYVLNEELEHCEVYVTGVVYIGGAGVAKGYYKSPERTSYQFITHPRSGEYLFRTGDLGRVRPCGNIEILGREDSQVKVNGYRIELGEIERVLMNDERLSSAVLNVCNNALCAYVVLSATGGDVEEEALFASLRDKCRSSLTDYMVPRHFMVLEEIPLSANGKVDRGKLPDVGFSSDSLHAEAKSLSAEFCLPVSDLESDILDCFAEILRLKASDICCERDSFFRLGGNSVTAIQLLFKICRTTGESITVQDLFTAPTVQGISNQILKKRECECAGAVEDDLYQASGYQILCLNKGASTYAPLLLFNPAGASGMCYSELVQAMNCNTPIYCLDDGGILRGSAGTDNGCNKESIEDVIVSIEALVRKFIIDHTSSDGDARRLSLSLGGWSYGGVIAIELAKHFARRNHSVAVESVVLFDCPVKASRSDRVKTDEHSPGGESQAHPEVVAKHFKYCTGLLEKMYASQDSLEPDRVLSCNVLDIRAKDSTYDCGGDCKKAIEALSDGKGEVIHHVTPGSHWSMLFEENAVHVASILSKFLSGK